MSKNEKPHNRIAELRKEKGLTLQQVADAIGVGNNTISRYETGKREPKLETWVKLADFFDVPVSYLQGFGDINYNDEDALIKDFNNSKLAKKMGIKAKPGDMVPIDVFVPKLRFRDQLFHHINSLVNLYIKSSSNNTTTISGPERKEYLSKINKLDEQELSQLDFDVEMLISLFLSGKNDKGLKEIEKILGDHYEKEFNWSDDFF